MQHATWHIKLKYTIYNMKQYIIYTYACIYSTIQTTTAIAHCTTAIAQQATTAPGPVKTKGTERAGSHSHQAPSTKRPKMQHLVSLHKAISFGPLGKRYWIGTCTGRFNWQELSTLGGAAPAAPLFPTSLPPPAQKKIHQLHRDVA
jgi:hypothetical protein